MKSATIGLALFFSACALVGAIWLSTSGNPLSGTPAAPLPPPDDDVGPKVPEKGPFAKVEAIEKTYNFGVMAHGSSGKHTFVLKNIGEAPLEVLAREEDTSCQCTLGKLSNDGKIAPGETVDVELQWTIKSPAENFRHFAIIRTNDPENRKLELVVEGRVDRPYVLTPEEVWEVGTVSGDETTTAKGTLVSAIYDKFEITGFDSISDRVKMTWTPLPAEKLAELNAKSGYEVKVEIAPGSPVGAFRVDSSLQVEPKTGESGDPIRFRLNGMRPGPIDVLSQVWRPEANAVLMGEFPAKDGKEITLSLFVRDLDEDLKILNSTQMYNSVEVTLEKDDKFKGSAQRYFLKVKVPPGTPANRQRKASEKINLEFNHPDAREMQILVDYLAI